MTDEQLMILIDKNESQTIFCDGYDLASLVTATGTIEQLEMLPKDVDFSIINNFVTNSLYEAALLEDLDKFKFALSRGALYRYPNPNPGFSREVSIYGFLFSENISVSFFKKMVKLDRGFNINSWDLISGVFSKDSIEYFQIIEPFILNLNSFRSDQKPLLEFAIDYGSTDLFEYLLSKNASLELKSETWGVTLREYAEDRGML